MVAKTVDLAQVQVPVQGTLTVITVEVVTVTILTDVMVLLIGTITTAAYSAREVHVLQAAHVHHTQAIAAQTVLAHVEDTIKRKPQPTATAMME